MTDLPSHHPAAVQAMFVLAALTFLTLTFLSAPYGRHARSGWGPTIPPRVGWIVMESPSVWFFAWVFLATQQAPGLTGWVLLILWLSHYVYRTFVYPLQMRVRPDDRMPAVIAAMAFVFNLLNCSVNAPTISGALGAYPTSWLVDPRFLIGVAMFVAGTVINRRADAALRALRQPGEKGYKIPRGGLYEYVSCPNYLGEMLEWTGWAVATWSVGGLAFAVYTAANLIPRARDNHAWYRATFPDYPPSRKAVFPGLL